MALPPPLRDPLSSPVRGRGRRRSTRPKQSRAPSEDEELDVYSEDGAEQDTPVQGKGPIAKAKRPRPPRPSVVIQDTRKRAAAAAAAAAPAVPEDAVEMPEGFDYLEISIGDPHAPEGPLSVAPPDDQRAGARSPPARRAYDRALRVATRHVHLLCLFLAYRLCSRAASTSLLKALCLSVVPPHLLRQFTREIILDGRTLTNSLSMLSNWWKNRCVRRVPEVAPEAVGPIHWLRARAGVGRLVAVLAAATGFDGDLVVLFLAILRGLGLPSRLVASLQPVMVRPIEGVGASAGEDFYRIPTFWCEVLHPQEKRWVAVDCLRAVVNDRLAMEPPNALLSKLGRQHLFIIGYDSAGRATDVSRRYCSRYFGWTARLRRSDELFLQNTIRLAAAPVDAAEDGELSMLVDGEALPDTLVGFHGHGRYMLESQLKKYEIFWPPDAGVVGEFRGQRVRLRSTVHKIRSKEAWYTQFGRVIAEGQEACKHVKLPKKPERKRRKVDDWEKPLVEESKKAGSASKSSDADDDRLQQPLYGEWQTVPYAPPVAKDGVVPRNKYGNVDLYLPSMLPAGCVWIANGEAWKAAKELGVDYAAACVRFAFSGRFAVPNLRGIVVCQEFEGAVLNRLGEMQAEEAEDYEESLKEQALAAARLKKRKQKIMDRILVNQDAALDSSAPGDGPPDKTAIVSALRDGGRRADEDFDDLF